MLRALAIVSLLVGCTARRQELRQPRSSATVASPKRVAPLPPAPRITTVVVRRVDPKTLSVRTSIPAELVPSGLSPKLDLAGVVASRPLELVRLGDRLEVEVVLPIRDAEAFEPAGDLVIAPNDAGGGGLELSLVSVVPHLVDASGIARWFIPNAEVTLDVGAPLASSLERRGASWFAESPDGLYGARVVAGPRLVVHETSSFTVASFDWPPDQLRALGDFLEVQRRQAETRLGTFRPLRLVIVGRSNQRGTSLPGNSSTRAMTLRLPTPPALVRTRLTPSALHELLHFAMPRALSVGLHESMTELLTLRYANDDAAFADALIHRWSMRKPERPEQAVIIERYYASPVLAFCTWGVEGVEAIVSSMNTKRDDAKLRDVEAQTKPWRDAASLGDEHVQRCLESRGWARQPSLRAVSPEALQRVFHATFSQNPANERGVRVVTATDPRLHVGDLLLTLEGREVENLPRLRELVAESVGKAFTIRVLRGSEMLELVFAPSFTAKDVVASERTPWERTR